jgi:hypothetical protein
MRNLRILFALAAVIVLASAAAPPVSTFPARFANRERCVAVGVLTGRGISRRNVQRTTNDDVLVFDDAQTLHIEDPDAPGGRLSATWRCPARRVVVVTMTPETVAALTDALDAQVPFPVRVTVGKARLVFGRRGAAYSGTQVIRCSGTYLGFRISIVETIRYSGTSAPAGAAASAAPGSLESAIAVAASRLADRLIAAAGRGAR